MNRTLLLPLVLVAACASDPDGTANGLTGPPLGDAGTRPAIKSPRTPNEPVRSLSAGGLWTCALLASGRVSCWGFIGEPHPSGTFVEISKGFYQQTCGRRDDGSVLCTGHPTDTDLNPAATERFSDLSVGAFHRCGLHLDGTLACAGEAPGTQPTDTFVEVSAGLTHTCARRKDGSVSCWGKVGLQTIPSPSGTFVRLESGNGTCGQRPDRTLSCWGSPVAPTSGTFADFDVGANNACGLRDDGSVECWGGSEYLNPPPGQYQQVSLGVQHGCGLLLSGEVLCWGDDQFGQATLPAAL